ncbi:MAG: hypothetical protein Q9227_004203 [Pyrenula ochraceoflavens]
MEANLPRVRACIFDVDGTLIDSEDIYTEIYNKILRSYGKEEYPWEIKATQQSRGASGTQRLLAWANLPLSAEEWGAKQKPYYHEFARCKDLPGVLKFLEKLSKTSPRVHMALASSAGEHLFNIKTTQVPQLGSYFTPELRIFGDDADMKGCEKKPSPDMFNLALRRINNLCNTIGELHLRSEECLVFEDSIAGVEAARRAGMRVVWIPHAGLAQVCRGREQEVLRGSTENDGMPPKFGDARHEEYEFQTSHENITSDDGLAEMIMSLEQFSFGRYSINVKDE